MSTTPNSMILPQVPRSVGAAATAAKTTYADIANAVLLAAAGTNGSVLRKLTAIARATDTATQLQLFRYDGTNAWLVQAPLLPAYTMAQTTADVPVDFGYSDSNTLYLSAGWSLYVGIGVALAGGVAFNADLGDY